MAELEIFACFARDEIGWRRLHKIRKMYRYLGARVCTIERATSLGQASLNRWR